MNGIKICGYIFEPSPNEWDRVYYVDFYLKVKEGSYIGIQIKPKTYGGSGVPSTHKMAVRDGNRKFTRKFRGKVFIVYREKATNFVDRETCELIKKEIERLSSL